MLNNGCYACSEVQPKWPLQNYYTSAYVCSGVFSVVLYSIFYVNFSKFVTVLKWYSVFSHFTKSLSLLFTPSVVCVHMEECVFIPSVQLKIMASPLYSLLPTKHQAWMATMPVLLPYCSSSKTAAFGQEEALPYVQSMIHHSQLELLSTWAHQTPFMLPFAHSFPTVFLPLVFVFVFVDHSIFIDPFLSPTSPNLSLLLVFIYK